MNLELYDYSSTAYDSKRGSLSEYVRGRSKRHGTWNGQVPSSQERRRSAWRARKHLPSGESQSWPMYTPSDASMEMFPRDFSRSHHFFVSCALHALEETGSEISSHGGVYSCVFYSNRDLSFACFCLISPSTLAYTWQLLRESWP